MQGFASTEVRTLERVHRALDSALGSGGMATPLRRCTLGEELDCDTALTFERLNDPTLYTASNCRLDRAIRVPPVVDPRNPPPDNLDPYRATVILTDGMQSATGAAGAGNDPVAACNAGADPNCVRLLLRDRIARGYGVWLVQIFLPFDGRHFAEEGLDRPTYEGIKAHVAEASLRMPYSEPAFEAGRRRNGRHAEPTLSVGRNFQVDGHQLASYAYRGWKPLLAWIIACSPQMGEQLVESFRAQLVARSILTDGGRRFFSVRVAPMAGLPQRFGPMTRVGDVAGRVDLGRPTRAPDGSGLVQRVTCDTEGRATLRIPIVAGSRGALQNPDFVRDAVSLDFAGRTLARDALSSPRSDGDGLLRTLRCERFPAGVHRETMVLQSSLSLGEIPADAWWREFDAPNPFAMPERVFGLRPLAEGLLAASAQRQFVWDTFTLEVERQ